MSEKKRRKTRSASATWLQGQCLCGNVELEIGVPARWAWHDHSEPSRRAHGAAYATYVGSYKSRFRITKGEASIARYEDMAAGRVRRFCKRSAANTPNCAVNEEATRMIVLVSA